MVGRKGEREKLQKVLEWSVREGFEVIEWSPPVSSHLHSNQACQEEEDEEGDGEGLGGTRRLAEALQAHMWPEMVMRSTTSSCEPQPDQKSPLTAASANLTTPPDQMYNSAQEEVLAEGGADSQDPDGESFEHLFARLADMKGIDCHTMHTVLRGQLLFHTCLGTLCVQFTQTHYYMKKGRIMQRRW